MTESATIEMCKCHCGHKWLPRVPEPQKCPKCGIREWREPKPYVKENHDSD